MIKNIVVFLAFSLLFVGCAHKQALLTQTATILIKTPKLKFYDKGFISKFDDYTKVEILSAGTSVLSLQIYEDRICRDTFECQNLESFNAEFLDKNYDKQFLKELFEKEDKEIIHRDKKNKILIKITKD